MLSPLGYEVVLVLHIISALIAVGTVTVIDYLHIVGLRDKRIEKKLLFVYTLLSRMLHAAIVFMFLTGAGLVGTRPELLQSSFFQTKMALFAIAVINGFYLNWKVFPEMDACVSKGKKFCSPKVLYTSSFAGALSVTTWYTILVLVLTKHFEHPIHKVWLAYVIIVLTAFVIALIAERTSRSWNY